MGDRTSLSTGHPSSAATSPATSSCATSLVQAPGFAPVMELDDAVVRRLEPTFLAEQSDEWMVELYTWLGGQRALFRASASTNPAPRGR